MSVDDVAVVALQAEFLQQGLTDSGILVIGIIGILRLRPGILIGNKAALKGGHPVAAKDRTVAAGPQPPQEVQTKLTFRAAALVVVGLSGGLLRIVQELLALALLAADGKGHEAAVFIHGDAAMEQQIPVDDLIQAAL